MTEPTSTPPRPAAPPPGPRPPGAPVSSVVVRSRLDQEILIQIEHLPALPSVVFEVLRLASSDGSSVKDLQRAIDPDQVLVGRILKLVNSSFYARSRRIGTIPDAIIALGFQTLKSLVAAASASRLLTRKMHAYGYEELGLWKHSIGCAAAVKSLAGTLALDRDLLSEFFVAALLHDIGKLVLDGFLGPLVAGYRVDLAAGVPHLEAERRAMGIDHAEVGIRIAKKWNFPPQVEETIRFHHSPESAGQYPTHTAVVHLTDHLLGSARLGLRADAPGPEPLHPCVLQSLRLDASGLARAHEALAAAMDDIRALCTSLAP